MAFTLLILVEIVRL